jgi:hypothetical protein
MRRWLPHALVAVGFLILLGVGLAVLFRGGGAKRPAVAPPPPPPTAATTTAQPPPPPPPPPPSTTAPSGGLAITSFAATSLSPYTATISWQTSKPATATFAWGLPDSGPTLWAPATAAGSFALPGLVAGTAYRVWLTVSAGGQQAQATLNVQTPPPGSPTVAIAGDTVLLDGQPFFPLMVWSLCPNGYGPALLVGIDLFAENPCGTGLADQLTALAGKALSAGVIGEPPATGPGLIGWFYEDEGDTKGLIPEAMQPPASGITFLTLSNHFFSGAAQLPNGKTLYPGLVARAGVVGFDLYPLQGWCKPDRLGDVYTAQQELVALAKGRPTFQWIEAGPMLCPEQGTPTPEEVRAESWLAIAAGAHGLGFFPSQWQPPVAAAITQVTHDVKALGPALLTPAVPADGTAPLRIVAHGYAGALYVIAVNPTFQPVQATIHVPGLAGRGLGVLDEGRQVAASGDSFSDAFAPLGVHVYVVAP